MKNNNNYCLIPLSVAIVLSGVAIGYGAAYGMAILSYARNPSLEEQIFDFLRTGLIVTMIPFVILIIFLLITSCFCRCSGCYRNDNRC